MMRAENISRDSFWVLFNWIADHWQGVFGERVSVSRSQVRLYFLLEGLSDVLLRGCQAERPWHHHSLQGPAAGNRLGDKQLHQTADRHRRYYATDLPLLFVWYTIREFSAYPVYPSRTPIHFLQESCRSGTYRTLSAWNNLTSILHFRQTCQILSDQTFLADSEVFCKILVSPDISCKILGRILQDKEILHENVRNVRWLFFQFYTKVFKLHDRVFIYIKTVKQFEHFGIKLKKQSPYIPNILLHNFFVLQNSWTDLNLQEMSDLTESDMFVWNVRCLEDYCRHIMSDMFHFCKILARNVWEYY